mmetsp:Transcript_26712/g.50840  ORF Transcript_26712/g.50840 Transcript_26712/m.50840 type:complete len:234 (-) Transcript_26712:1724-2425(-)
MILPVLKERFRAGGRGALWVVSSLQPGNHIQEVFRRRPSIRHLESQILEIRVHPLLAAHVHGASARAQQQQVVKHAEDLKRRLMANHPDCDVGARHRAQRTHDELGGRAVQSRRGLVTEQQHGINNELNADVDSLPLSPRYASCDSISHHRVLHFLQPQHTHGSLHKHQLVLAAQAMGQANIGVQPKVLVHRQIAVHDVILGHEAHHWPHGFKVTFVAVDQNLTRALPKRRLI